MAVYPALSIQSDGCADACFCGALQRFNALNRREHLATPKFMAI